MTTRTVLAGLVVVHFLWAASFLTGSLLLRILQNGERRDGGRLERAIDFILASALGMATIILGLFILGTIGLLNPTACALAWVLAVVALLVILRAGGTSFPNITDAIIQPLGIFRSRAVLAIYGIALVESIPASLPPVAWDSTMYHLASAVMWAHSGHLDADPFLRAPYNAYNFELLFSLAFVFHLDRFVLFIDWLPFVCTALGIHVLTTWLLSRYVLPGLQSLRHCSALGFATALAFLASPLVLSYALIGYVDVASSFFLLAATAALLRSLDRFRPYALAAAPIAGTFVGTKIQLALFVPLIVVILLYIARIMHVPRRLAAASLLVFVVFAAPWYARNLVATGDPLTPTLNVLIGRSDPIYSKVDYDGIRWNLRYGPQTILDAPIDFILNRTPPGFLFDQGTSTSIALVGVMPLAALLLILFRTRWRVAPPILVLGVTVAYAVLATMAVSVTIGRYALTYFPIFLAMLSFLAVALIKLLLERWKIQTSTPLSVAGTILILLLGLPEPKSALAYQNYTSSFAAVRLAAKYPDQYLGIL